MDSAGYTVEKLVGSDLDATADVLARAFSDNACYAFIHARVAHRERSLRAFFRRNLVWHLPLQLSWVARSSRGAILGTFTLEPPQGVPSTLLQAIRHWAVPTCLQDGLETLRRLVITETEFKQQYERICGKRAYWHVHAVAVDPEHQGQGVGRGMLQAALSALQELTRERPAPVLLSTQRQNNVPFYQAHGFELSHETRLGLSRGEPGYSSWFMRHPVLSAGVRQAPRLAHEGRSGARA